MLVSDGTSCVGRRPVRCPVSYAVTSTSAAYVGYRLDRGVVVVVVVDVDEQSISSLSARCPRRLTFPRSSYYINIHTCLRAGLTSGVGVATGPAQPTATCNNTYSTGRFQPTRQLENEQQSINQSIY